MIAILSVCGAVVALILAHFLLGGLVADWLDRECDEMLAQAQTERDWWYRAWVVGLHVDADRHLENANMLLRNIRACQRVAGWLR